MKILHFTDLHYSNEKKNSVESLLKDLSSYNLQNPIVADLIIFSGDLVMSGNIKNDFENAEINFIQRVSEIFKVKNKNILFTCGNHDIARGEEIKIVTKSLNDISNNDDLNLFVNDQEQLKLSLKNIENYNDFLKSYYNANTSDLSNKEFDIIKDLYSIHNRIIDGNEITIASINTAWRCFNSKLDSGNLMFPTSIMHELLDEIKAFKNKILIYHHPLSDLKYFNMVEMKKLILNNFIITFNGHTHIKEDVINISNNEGLVSINSEASLCKVSKSEKIGFSYIDLNLREMKLSINNLRYDEDFFYETFNHKEIDIPVEDGKREMIKLTMRILDLYELENEKFAKLFVTYEKGKKFNDLFSNPNLKDSSITTLKAFSTPKSASKINFKNLSSKTDNYIIFGKDKCGKSILLHGIYLDLLKKFDKEQILPIIINNDKSSFDIVQIIREKFAVNTTLAKKILDQYTVKIIIDNFDKVNNEIKNELDEHLTKYPHHKYVIGYNENLLSEFNEVVIDSTSYNKVYIHDLTLDDVKLMTIKTFDHDKDLVSEVLNKINLTLRQLNIPLNYWTVSLFIWIFKQNNKKSFNDNFELIELYIDNLLGKEFIISNDSFKTSYEDLKGLLGFIAYKLTSDCSDFHYKAEYLKILSFIEEYKGLYPKFVIKVKEVYDLLIEKHIFIETEDLVTFRLKGVFEYFLAFYLKDEIELRNQIIESDSHYLSYGNELELIAGFNKKDEEFVKRIFDKTKIYFDGIHKEYGLEGELDVILLNKTKNINFHLEEHKKGIKGLITKGVQEDLRILNNDSFDSEIQRKKIYDSIEISSENLEKLLFILSRVSRNSNLKDAKLSNEVFEYIIDSACYLCFYLVDNDLLVEKTSNASLKVFSQLIPLVIQTFLKDAISQNNLEQIYLNKIEELKINQNNNQLKLFILYFLLIDLDVKNNKKYISQLIDITNEFVLKQAVFYKLLSYLIFNNTSYNESVIDEVRSYVRDINKKLPEPNRNIDKFLKDIDKLSFKNKKLL